MSCDYPFVMLGCTALNAETNKKANSEDPSIKWTNIGGKEASFVEMRRSGASDSYELSLVYDDGSGHTSYHKLIDTSGRKLWLNPGLIGAAVGNGKQLLYVNSNGTVNTSNSSSGGTDQPAYLGSGEIKPCDFKCWHYQPGTGKYTFQYEHIAIIFLHRGDGFKIAFCDNWNAKKDVVSNNMDDVTVSVSNKTVTINSTRSSSVSAMIITS